MNAAPNSLQPKKKAFALPCIDRLRFILMIFFMIGLFGFPSPIGGYVSIFSGFAAPAFFIISGYLVLWNADLRGERIVRTIKRTAIAFFSLLAVYLIINLILDVKGTLAAFGSKRFWFSLVVLNSFDLSVGTSIWYVQSLLYAYIIIWGLNKLKLLRFDWIIMILCFAFSILSGELAGVTGIRLPWYSYIGSNWLTRALPYVLLGGLIHRKDELLKRISPVQYVIAAAVGTLSIFAELQLLISFDVLVYYGHLFGMGLLAASVCTLTILHNDPGFLNPVIDGIFTGSGINAIYYICEVVYVGVFFALRSAPDVIFQFIGVITVIVCIGIVALYRVVMINIEWKQRLKNQGHE